MWYNLELETALLDAPMRQWNLNPASFPFCSLPPFSRQWWPSTSLLPLSRFPGSRELIGRLGVPVAPDRCALVVSLMTSFSKMPLFTTVETTLFPCLGDSCVLCALCHYLRSIELPLLYCETLWTMMQLALSVAPIFP